MNLSKHATLISYIVLIYTVNTMSLYHNYPIFLAGFAFFIFSQTFSKKTMIYYSLLVNTTIEIHFGFVLFSLTVLYFIVDKYVLMFVRKYIKISYSSVFLPVLIFYPFFILYLFFYFNINKQILQNIMVNLTIDFFLILVFGIMFKNHNNKATI